MKSPEAVTSSTPINISTVQEGVRVKSLTAEDLPRFEEFVERNTDHLVKGGLIPDALVEMTQRDVADSTTDIKRMGIFKDNDLVGYISVNPYDKEDGVEVAYAVDKDQVRKGISLAALKAVTVYENELGNDVYAEVERHNPASMKLLDKAGYDRDRFDHVDSREIFVSQSHTEAALRAKYPGWF